MKKTACVFLLLIALLIGYSQPVIKVDRYTSETGNPADKLVTIAMPYAGYSIISIEGDTAGLFNAGEIIIDVVCTDYPSHASLEELNKNRLSVFYQLFPFVDRSTVKAVNCWRQLEGDTKENAQPLFHGVVIKYRLRQTAETIKHDLVELDKLLGERKKEEPPMLGELSLEERPIEIIRSDDLKGSKKGMVDSEMVYIGATSYQIKVWDKNVETFKNADSIAVMSLSDATRKGFWSIPSYKDFQTHDKVYVYFKKKPKYWRGTYVPLDSIGVTSIPLTDSSLFNIFSRNKWKNISVTGDVTGSMYPYTAQLLIWLKLQSLDSLTHRFTFFNDGDNKTDNEKRIGATGGIYSKECKSFEEVKELVKSTMQKGGGGDAPENNIEALLAAEKEFPDISFHVMIADNWAPVKDKELVKHLRKPVRIVLCGVDGSKVNVDYLNLARASGGSLHLMEEDLVDLAKIHEGQTISIGNNKYRLVKGEFVEILSL